MNGIVCHLPFFSLTLRRLSLYYASKSSTADRYVPSHYYDVLADKVGYIKKASPYAGLAFFAQDKFLSRTGSF
jgi:hypothetical protein